MEKDFSKDSKITVMIMCAAATAIYELFVYLYKGAVLSANIEMFIFIRILIVEILYNTLLAIILYPLMQKLGYKIESVFNKTPILTRYF